VSTANTASTNASTAVTTANTAISTANAAASAVASAILYDIVANVAAIPGSPANNDAVEITNSTGIESFSPLSGLPSGFVGNSALSVRLVYTTSGSTWNWIQYFPNDPETRYLKTGTGTVTSTNIADGTIVNADINASAAIAGTKISPDFGSQNVTTTGTATAAALIPSGSSVPMNGVYLPSSNNVAISTNSSQRLLIDASGRVGVGNASPGSYESTFSQLVVGSSGANGITIVSDTASNGNIAFADGTAGLDKYRGYIQYIHSTNALAFGTDGAERFRVDSSGRLGLGTSSPGSTLTVKSPGASNTFIDALNSGNTSIFSLTQSSGGSGQLKLADSTGTTFLTADAAAGRVAIGTTSASGKLHVSSGASSALISANADDLIVENNGNCGITIATPNSGIGAIRFADPQNDDSGAIFYNHNTEVLSLNTFSTERMRIDSSGRLLVGTASANANGGVLQLSGGITFPATAVAASDANTLDDYEEGTFTPTLTATTGSVSGYGAQSGTYKKIGSLVVCNIYLYLTNKGTLSGALKVDSLPFTGASGLQMQGVATYYLGMAINVVEVTCFSSSGTFVNLRRSTAASTANNTTLDSSEINNNFEIMMMLTYFV
jgi:hypothetical protein